MSVEASGGGASVGSSDRSGGNNVGGECRSPIEEPSDQRFSEEEKKQFVSFEKALDEVVNKTGRPTDAKQPKPKIQKVPSMLRDNNKLKKYFEPKVFSVGPYYHTDRTLKMAKQFKVNLAAKFLEQNGVKKEDLYEDIKKEIQVLRGCYDDELTKNYEDHKLAWMFLVDGCAILHFMYISVDFREDPETQITNLGIKIDYAVFLAVDMFLLENQLPYRLLQIIIRHASKQGPEKKEDLLLKSIYKFIFYYIRSPEEWFGNEDKILENLKDNHVHLLDLLRKALIQPLHQTHKKHDFIEITMDWTADLFDKLRCNRNKYWVPAVPFRNIGKLREAGINLKPSETSCVTDITFIGGTLKLPQIFLDESTASTFLNILGYEMCPDFPNKSEFITYMYFLDKLIDRTQDVEELREKNILQHGFGRDDEVAELFNEIGSHLFPNYEIYSKVKWNFDKYFHNKGFMWLRKVIHDIHQYFKNRWSLLALIAALLALASGIIQTVYTVSAYHADSKKGN
ncbi:hypothetical protein Dsin_011963 [Dipteronia sinensis]|uniref:Uncharacterized protein n=1 Tax=Dipteronia sinensis TaxID=43782 RepID=A0AAE0AH46_9ROSI|nr:hypothetical protein Dsin_011949 [Dipteronia sinensis]KAK3217993.1 hypothetical protein Dsin_011963 [Dipteronia sinensis]